MTARHERGEQTRRASGHKRHNVQASRKCSYVRVGVVEVDTVNELVGDGVPEPANDDKVASVERIEERKLRSPTPTPGAPNADTCARRWNAPVPVAVTLLLELPLLDTLGLLDNDPEALEEAADAVEGGAAKVWKQIRTALKTARDQECAVLPF